MSRAARPPSRAATSKPTPGTDIAIAGGAAHINNLSAVDSTLSVTENRTTVAGTTTFGAAPNIYGAMVTGKSDRSITAEALKNRITFSTGATVDRLYGGCIDVESDGILGLKANENTLTIKAGANNVVYGGYARGTSRNTMPLVSDAEANANVVTIEAGSGTFEQYVHGGSADLTNEHGHVRVTAAGNDLPLSGGTFRAGAFGGDASADTRAGDAEVTAARNKLHLRGALFADDRDTRVYGGYARAYNQTGIPRVRVVNNTIDGTLRNDRVQLHAGYGELKQDVATTAAVIGRLTDNTLTLTDSDVGSAYGGHLNLIEAYGTATLDVARNHVTLTGAANTSSAVMCGARIETANVHEMLQITADENTVTAEGFDLRPATIHGTQLFMNTTSVDTANITLKNSRATVDGREVSETAGAYAGLRTNGLVAQLTGNTAAVRGRYLTRTYGVRADITQWGGTADVTAERNTATAEKVTGDISKLFGAQIEYRRDYSATTPRPVKLTARENAAVLTEGTAALHSSPRRRVR